MCDFIWDAYTTLNKCRETMEKQMTGAYLRFGDGDIYLRDGGDDSLQRGNSKISSEMKEAFSLSGEGIIKCLPLHSDKFGCMLKMGPGVHKWDDGHAEWMLESSRQYFKDEPIYSPVALHYLGVHDRPYTVHFLRFIRQLKPIFVGNENIPPEIVNQLFNAKIHIKTPPQQSYVEMDRIERDTLEALDKDVDQYKIVVLAMGTSGRPFVNRILKRHKYKVFLFDFGSLLDALCGWDTRAWIGLSSVPTNYWHEMLNDIARE